MTSRVDELAQEFCSAEWLAFDPGNTDTGWVVCSENEDVVGHLDISGFGHDRNVTIRRALHAIRKQHKNHMLIVECPRPRGQLMSAESMETLIEIGRFMQMWRGPWSFAFRGEVKYSLLGTNKGKDSQVTQAIKDRFGGETRAVGGKKCKTCKGAGERGRAVCPTCGLATQKNNDCVHCDGGKNKENYRKKQCRDCDGLGWAIPPGPLYGVVDHVWAALGVACWWQDSERSVNHEIAGKQPRKRKKKKT